MKNGGLIIILGVLATTVGCSKEEAIESYVMPQRSTVSSSHDYVLTYEVRPDGVIRTQYVFVGGDVLLAPMLLREEEGTVLEYSQGAKGEIWEKKYPRAPTVGEKYIETWSGQAGVVSKVGQKIKIDGKERECIEFVKPIQFPIPAPFTTVYCKDIGAVASFFGSNNDGFPLAVSHPSDRDFDNDVATQLLRLFVRNKLRRGEGEAVEKLTETYTRVLTRVAGLGKKNFYSLEDEKFYKYGIRGYFGLIDSAIFVGCIMHASPESVATYLEYEDSLAPFGNSVEGVEFAAAISGCLDKTVKLQQSTAEFIASAAGR